MRSNSRAFSGARFLQRRAIISIVFINIVNIIIIRHSSSIIISIIIIRKTCAQWPQHEAYILLFASSNARAGHPKYENHRSAQASP
jgi:hypothetical protein